MHSREDTARPAPPHPFLEQQNVRAGRTQRGGCLGVTPRTAQVTTARDRTRGRPLGNARPVDPPAGRVPCPGTLGPHRLQRSIQRKAPAGRTQSRAHRIQTSDCPDGNSSLERGHVVSEGQHQNENQPCPHSDRHLLFIYPSNQQTCREPGGNETVCVQELWTQQS